MFSWVLKCSRSPTLRPVTPLDRRPFGQASLCELPNFVPVPRAPGAPGSALAPRSGARERNRAFHGPEALGIAQAAEEEEVAVVLEEGVRVQDFQLLDLRAAKSRCSAGVPLTSAVSDRFLKVDFGW